MQSKDWFPKNDAWSYEKSTDIKEGLTPADKTFSMYRLNKNDHKILLKNAITANYKKANENIGTKSNKEGNKLAKQTDISDKIKMNGHR